VNVLLEHSGLAIFSDSGSSSTGVTALT